MYWSSEIGMEKPEAVGRVVDALECVTYLRRRTAASGDATARQALQVYQDRLARGLASVVNIVDPDVIVLGGGLSNIDGVYDGLAQLIARYVFSDAVDTTIVRAVHGDSSGVRGAAWLWGEGEG